MYKEIIKQKELEMLTLEREKARLEMLDDIAVEKIASDEKKLLELAEEIEVLSAKKVKVKVEESADHFNYTVGLPLMFTNLVGLAVSLFVPLTAMQLAYAGFFMVGLSTYIYSFVTRKDRKLAKEKALKEAKEDRKLEIKEKEQLALEREYAIDAFDLQRRKIVESTKVANIRIKAIKEQLIDLRAARIYYENEPKDNTQSAQDEYKKILHK